MNFDIARSESAGMRGKRILVFFFPEMEFLADRLCALRSVYEKGSISWELFPDGTPKVKIVNASHIRYSHVLLLTSFRQPDRWMEQIAVIYALPRYMAKSLTVVLPFFPTGTMERVETEGEIATAMTMARMLSCVPCTMQGPARFMMFDVHTLQQRFYFGDGVIPCLVTAMGLLLAELQHHPEAEKICIVFPDEGAKKRFGAYFAGHYPLVVCAKERAGKERVIRIAEGEAEGRHCVIVDDLVQSGGTLRVCKDALLQLGAISISGFITHAVFPNDAWMKFINDGWGTLYLTDTIPETTKKLEGQPPFKIISIAPEVDRFFCS